MKTIDCNVVAGDRHKVDPWRDDSFDSLLRAMESCAIDEAHVAHMRSLEYDSMAGNEKLLDEIDCHPNLHPVWVITPSAAGDMPGPKGLIPMMRDAGVRMLRTYPNRHNFVFSRWNLGDWFEVMEERKIPLVLDFMDGGNWNAIHEVMTGHPNLRVIVTNAFYRNERNIASLMGILPNLHIEISTYKVNFGVERLVSKFGDDRLLFGSNMMEFAPGPAVAVASHLDIPDESKAAIFHGNIERLLSEVTL